MTVHSIYTIKQPPDARNHPSLGTWAVLKSLTLSVISVLSVSLFQSALLWEISSSSAFPVLLFKFEL